MVSYKSDFSKKAVIYARVSTEEQANKDNSIPAQVQIIKRFALNNGIEIVGEYLDEGKSARTADRPQFQQMISDAKKKDKSFSIILVHKTDRFSRNRSDSVIYKSLLQKQCHVDVISVTENFDSSPTGKLLEGMMEVIAEFYSLNLSQEVFKGMSQKATVAAYLGRAPFGYNLNPTTKKLEINEEEATTVRLIFELYEKAESFGSIKKELNLANILTREKKLWDSSSIKRILKNSAYTGQYTWNKTQNSNRSKKSPDNWIVVDNAHEPIIDSELFYKVQRIIDSKSKMPGPAIKSDYLLSTLVKCGSCGHNMIGDKRKSGDKVYFRYVCGNHLTHRMCFYNFVHKEAIENLVFENIRNILKEGNIDPNNVIISKPSSSKSEIDLLEAKLKKIKQKFQKQLEAFEADIISLSELQVAKNRVKSEENEIIEQLEKLNSKESDTDLDSSFKTNFSDIDKIISSNNPKIIKLWLKERIHKIEVFNKVDVKIQYKLLI